MRDYSLPGLLSPITALSAFGALRAAAGAAARGAVLGPLGLPEAVRSAVVGALAQSLAAPILWLTDQPDTARAVAEGLSAFVPGHPVHLFPAPDALSFERIPWDPATREQRMAGLAALHRWGSLGAADPRRGLAPILVAPVRGLLTCTLPPAEFGADVQLLSAGGTIGITPLLHTLQRLGYETVGTVNEPGQAAHRGGIVDIFPPSESQPVRIEWFGDEIESLRHFDPVNQRSHTPIGAILITPAAEALPGRGPAVAEALAAVDMRRLHPLAESELRRQREHLANAERFNGLEFYGSLLHPERSTLLAYLPADSWIVADDPEQLANVAAGVHGQAETTRLEQVDAGELPADWPGRPLAAWYDVAADLAKFRQVIVGLSGASAQQGLAAEFGQPPRYGGRIEEAVLDVAELTAAGQAVVLVSRQAPRIVELLGDMGLHTAATQHLEVAPGPGGLAVVHGALAAGFTIGRKLDVSDPEFEADPTPPVFRVAEPSKSSNGRGSNHRSAGTDRKGAGAGSNDSNTTFTVVVSDAELFGWQMPFQRRRSRPRDAVRGADFFSEFTPGDYIVHIEHGIGVFRGLARMSVGGVERDYLHVEYAQGDTLYVPTHQADRVTRYVGTGGEAGPTISRLGTIDWERAKARAKRAVEDIARELLELYARRETARRTAFAVDTSWQAEMEASFPFMETDDQLRAIQDVKRDMESERPMDRLVVGDVGFGKTEVALRAAFKAVMDGRQVAVLAPTTVLAQQHYETFRRRFGTFPVRIEVLSRFRAKREQAEVLDRLATREVDIVVGTHRLLSADVRFKDLGLLIIDEEHRFGVKHKERLRQLRESVDTLTLTATPIPRTMHMALTGLRDLTTIDTPPEERLPVATHVGAYDDTLVRQALRRELSRNGQAFYVYNRVQGIEMIAQKVVKLIPEARVGIAHGQMKEDDLARAMLNFVGGVTDVLVCTSIIESGLDIPNANTLIVERADRFGLAQLHQLRGRVGRSAQRAYAYFLYPPGNVLPAEAALRLSALAEAHALGSGFRLAMRDLEIRGAGEILGARQHGQVSAIGLDLYTRLLAEAIKKLRADADGQATDDPVSAELEAIDPGTLPTVDLPLDAFLPDTYVAETNERTRLYRRMAQADTRAAVAEIDHELADRFGPPPAEVRHLLAVLRLRVLAYLAGAQSIGREVTPSGLAVAIRWKADYDLHRTPLKALLHPSAMVGQHQITLPVQGSAERWLPGIVNALETAIRVEGPTRRAGPRA